MATTSLLFHAFGLRNYRLLSTDYTQGKTVFHIKLKDSKRHCASCNSVNITKAGVFTRTFREVPIGKRSTYLVLHGHRHHCKCCSALCQEPILFAYPYKRYTRCFARYIVELARSMALVHIAAFLGISWDLVKVVFQLHLQTKLKRRKLSSVRYLAIDEFAVKKGHHYMSIVMDLETGAVLHACPGKDARSLLPFIWKLKRAQAPLQAVAMDMSQAYYNAIKTVFPDVDIVHDPYHLVTLLNRAIDQVRKDLYRTLTQKGRAIVRGIRFLLLTGLEKLKPSQLDRLAWLMELNQPLYQAYLLKEDLRHFWNFSNTRQALAFLADWLQQAVATGLKPFIRFALTLIRHLDGLLAYFKHRISTGPLEGLNNKIKTLKRQAYGFRDMNFFILRLLFIHESTYSVTG